MRTLIIAMNSRYIHSSLAPWYLKAACGGSCGEVYVREFTINENIETVLSEIYSEKPDVVAFSCYIWNIGLVLRIAENLKKLQPKMLIILGGPEVSYDALEMMEGDSFLDFIISGEGEIPFGRLLECVDRERLDKLNEIGGLTYRKDNGEICVNKDKSGFSKNKDKNELSKNKVNDKISINEDRCASDLDYIRSPYTDDMLNSIKGKIAYFEASRGCPYSCTYCLSSKTSGVSFFSMDRVKSDLSKLIDSDVRQIKFVDRTFNCNVKRAKEIISFILDHYNASRNSVEIEQMKNFHFEAAADLFDEEMLQLLAKAPAGLFQMEIGVQSVNEQTLDAVNRKTDLTKVFKNIQRLRELDNIHIHLDLIAGLPDEDFESFKDSFNKVYSLSPHALQLGFLKLLKGSAIRREADLHGYVFRNYPPYEVLYNKYISYDDLMILKDIEDLVDRYYNSGRFKFTLDYIINGYFHSPFDFYSSFSGFNSSKSCSIQNKSARELYMVLLEYALSIDGIDIDKLQDCLKLDYLSADDSGHVPFNLGRIEKAGFQDKCFRFLADKALVEKYIPHYSGLPAKQIYKKVHFELFSNNLLDCAEATSGPFIILFDYSRKCPVTEHFAYQMVKF